MQTREIRQLLNFTSAGCCLLAGAALLWGFFPVGRTNSSSPSATNQRDKRDVAPKATGLGSESMADLHLLCSRRLQSGLQRAAASEDLDAIQQHFVARKGEPSLVDRLGIHLVGTVIEAGNSIAIVSDRHGHIDLRNEGEDFRLQPAGIQLVAIHGNRVVLRFENQDAELLVGQGASGSVAYADQPVAADNTETDIEMEDPDWDTSANSFPGSDGDNMESNLGEEADEPNTASEDEMDQEMGMGAHGDAWWLPSDSDDPEADWTQDGGDYNEM